MAFPGPDGITYYPSVFQPGKALIQAAFFGANANTLPPVFPHIAPLLFQPCNMGAGGRTIPCPAIREKDPAAHRASLCVRGRSAAGQRCLQHRIIGQNSLPEVAAVRTSPALVHHIARPAQRQTAIFPVIVSAEPCHQLADRRLFLPCQLPLSHSVTSCHRAF